MHARAGAPTRRGSTLIEIVIAAAILAAVILAIFGVVRRDTDLSRATLGIAVAEIQAQEMLREVETELADARATRARTVLAQTISATETNLMAASSTLGFPNEGVLLVDPGTAWEERIRYRQLVAGLPRFRFLQRGQQCTQGASHSAGADVLWIGLADVIGTDEPEDPFAWDGRAMEPTGPVFFRGDGIGFSYRVPVDPDAAPGAPPDYFEGGEVQWGAEIAGTGSTTGWTMLYFAPEVEIFEGATRDDINGDGDFLDRYDVGQIRRRVWNTADATVKPLDVGIGPRSILQERCNWGGDLDSDGFDDPIFLWDEEHHSLHIRLFVLGRSVSNIPIVRRVESMVFLRNQPTS